MSFNDHQGRDDAVETVKAGRHVGKDGESMQIVAKHSRVKFEPCLRGFDLEGINAISGTGRIIGTGGGAEPSTSTSIVMTIFPALPAS